MSSVEGIGVWRAKATLWQLADQYVIDAVKELLRLGQIPDRNRASEHTPAELDLIHRFAQATSAERALLRDG